MSSLEKGLQNDVQIMDIPFSSGIATVQITNFFVGCTQFLGLKPSDPTFTNYNPICTTYTCAISEGICITTLTFKSSNADDAQTYRMAWCNKGNPNLTLI